MNYAVFAIIIPTISLGAGIIETTLQELAIWSEINALMRQELIYTPCANLYQSIVSKNNPNTYLDTGLDTKNIEHSTSITNRSIPEKRGGFAALAGEIPEEVLEITSFIQNREQYIKVGARMPRGILLWGPPGTGKTSIARAIAEEAGAAFINCSASEFINLYVGKGPASVRDLFDRARHDADRSSTHKAIIFIDEIDAIGSKRNEETNSEYRNTLNELLNQIDGFTSDSRIFVIAATNNPKQLDNALLRRLERHVHIGLPDEESRTAIITQYAKQIAYSGSPEIFKSLAKKTSGWSGDQLRTLVNEAAIRAARRKSDIVESDDFFTALTTISTGKI